MLIVEKLHWDSEFFGFPVVSVYTDTSKGVKEKLLVQKEQNIQLAYVFLPSDAGLLDIHLLKEFNGVLVDKKITYAMEVNIETPNFFNPSIKTNYYKHPNKQLEKLSIIAGKYSRFNIDQNITQEQFESLYLEWIKQSVIKKNADYIFSYHANEELLGLVTLAINAADKTGRIGLISVSVQQQKSGIGSSLLKHVVANCVTNHIKKLEVVTQQDNISACKFYEKNGFIKKQVQNIYHFWLQK